MSGSLIGFSRMQQNQKMKILLIGTNAHLEEARQKFGKGNHYALKIKHAAAEKILSNYEVIFDFIIDENPAAISIYQNHHSPIVFLNTTFVSLSQLQAKGSFGFCGLPTFLNREVLEVSLIKGMDPTTLRKFCDQLKTKYELVADKVGLVTPRIICMIINEAYCTVEEGTATQEDIDKAMKLGTNYPFGPFEWCEQIGSKNVVRLLDAMYQNTEDTRYKVCQLLRGEKRF